MIKGNISLKCQSERTARHIYFNFYPFIWRHYFIGHYDLSEQQCLQRPVQGQQSPGVNTGPLRLWWVLFTTISLSHCRDPRLQELQDLFQRKGLACQSSVTWKVSLLLGTLVRLSYLLCHLPSWPFYCAEVAWVLCCYIWFAYIQSWTGTETPQKGQVTIGLCSCGFWTGGQG